MIGDNATKEYPWGYQYYSNGLIYINNVDDVDWMQCDGFNPRHYASLPWNYLREQYHIKNPFIENAIDNNAIRWYNPNTTKYFTR